MQARDRPVPPAPHRPVPADGPRDDPVRPGDRPEARRRRGPQSRPATTPGGAQGDGALVPARLGRPDHRPTGDRRGGPSRRWSRHCDGSSSAEGCWEDRRGREGASGSGSSGCTGSCSPGCRPAAGTSRRARATRSRRSRSTACSGAAGWAPGGSPDATRGIPAATTRSADHDEDRVTRSRLRSDARAGSLPLLAPRRRRPAARRRLRRAGPAPSSPAAAARPDRDAHPRGRDPARAGDVRRSTRSAPRLAVHPIFQAFFILLGPASTRLTGEHRDRDHPADDRPPSPDDPALPAPDRVVAAGCSSSSPRSRRSRSATRATGSRPRPRRRQLYKERGISPLSGCLPILLVMLLADPDVHGHSAGPDATRPQAMLNVFGSSRSSTCTARRAGDQREPGTCIPVPRPDRLGWATGASRPVLFTARHAFGISVLGLIVGAAPAVQSPDQPAAGPTVDRTTRTSASSARWCSIFPLIYVFLGGILPAGLFLYYRRVDDLLDHPAVPHRRLGRDVPVLRLDAGVRRRPHAAIPGRPATPGRPARAGRRTSPLGECRPARPPRSTRRSATRNAAARAAEGDDADECLPASSPARPSRRRCKAAREEFGVEPRTTSTSRS